MSKRFGIAIAVFFTLLFLIRLSPTAQLPDKKPNTNEFGGASIPAKSANSTSSATYNELDEGNITPFTNDLLEEVSRMRGLKILTPVKSGYKSRNDIRNEIMRNFEQSIKPEEIDAISKNLKAYGLIPTDFNYRDFMIQLLTEQVAGFYRPKTKELYIADWNEISQQKPVMAHELTHALQDQHFNLQQYENWPNGDADRESAIHALIEGDATGVMYDYQLKPLKSDISRLPSFANFSEQILSNGDKEGQKVFASAPPAIRESLIFPYVYGVGFVQQLVKQKGWDGVSLAYKNLPQSTEQIIHFDKYIAREQPVSIKLPDVSSLLGKHWQKLDADINGEFGYFLILSEFIGRRDAKIAVEGWGGDHSILYENKSSKQLLITHVSVWDSNKDAEEFEKAYIRRTLKRYPKTSMLKSTDDKLIKSSNGTSLIGRRNNKVLIIEEYPGDVELLNKIAKALY